jgi:hypothetical protein
VASDFGKSSPETYAKYDVMNRLKIRSIDLFIIEAVCEPTVSPLA